MNYRIILYITGWVFNLQAILYGASLYHGAYYQGGGDL